MAAASVMTPMSSVESTIPPSALIQHSPRHGRNRAASMKKGNRYHVQENREGAIAKAVSFVLKRAVTQSELEEESEDEDEEATDDRLVSSDDGWVMLPELLQQSRITDLETSVVDLRRIASNKSKARFELRQKPGSDAEKAESYQIRNTHKRESLQAPILEGEPLKADSEDLPDYVVYETTYEAYPHILASDGIQKAAGATHITFSPIAADGSEVRLNRTSDADIGIWVHLRTALEQEPSIVWQKTAAGAFVTANEIPKGLWKKAVARRQDIGVLFEDGQVRKEVPRGLRGKGSKGKAKKAKGAFLKSRGGENASDSASDE